MTAFSLRFAGHRRWKAAFRALVLATMPLFLVVQASAQDTPDYFRQNCMNCHTIGGGRLTGPDLKNVEARQDREWLIGFMMDPKSYIDRGDPYAMKILEESRKVPMPALPGLDLAMRRLAQAYDERPARPMSEVHRVILESLDARQGGSAGAAPEAA